MEACASGSDVLLPKKVAAKIVGIGEERIRRLIKIGEVPTVDKFGGVSLVKLGAVPNAAMRSPERPSSETGKEASHV
jgi:hypothetical protein